MSERQDPTAAWGEVSAAAARATGFRGAIPASVRRRWSGVGSIGLMTVALAVIVTALALRPGSGPGTNGPVTAEADDGMFRLELSTPRGTYGPGDAIRTVARVTYLGPGGAITVQHSHSRLVFRIQEIDGARAMDGGSRLSCESTNLVQGEPLVVPFGKSGSPDDPTKGFDLAWYEDPVLTLPVGSWRITANLDFGVEGCDVTHRLAVSNVIRVVAPAGDGPVVDLADDGVFSLELSAPRRAYAPTEAIEPIATVSYLGPADEIGIYRAGSIVGWVIEEVGGNRTMSGVMTAPCISDVMRKDTPLAFPLAKSGAYDETFDRAWFDDPFLHLPVGTWRIQAYTTIAADDGPAPSDGSFTCGTRGHGQSAAIVVTVVGDAASASPMATPTTEPSPSARIATPPPSFSADPVVGVADDGMFRLELTTPHGRYDPSQPIEPVATLTFLGPADSVMFGYGDPAVTFAVDEVGGDRRMSGDSSEVCSSATIARGARDEIPFTLGPDQPVLTLPVGTWRITATLSAYVPDCGLDGIHHVTVENVVEVVAPGSAPSETTSSSDADRAFQVATLYETARVEGREDAWKLLSPWSQALFGSQTAFERAQADLNVLGYRRFEVGAPSRDPDLLSASFLGGRAADLAATADPARTFVVSVRYPEVDGAAAATLNLVVAVRLGTTSDWEIWLDSGASGR